MHNWTELWVINCIGREFRVVENLENPILGRDNKVCVAILFYNKRKKFVATRLWLGNSTLRKSSSRHNVML